MMIDHHADNDDDENDDDEQVFLGVGAGADIPTLSFSLFYPILISTYLFVVLTLWNQARHHRTGLVTCSFRFLSFNWTLRKWFLSKPGLQLAISGLFGDRAMLWRGALSTFGA